jgi:hypothetical protein
MLKFLLFICLLLSCEKEYPNTEKNKSGDIVPAPGFVWDRDQGSKKYAVKWVVDERHPVISHVFTGELENSWVPEPGYGWVGYSLDSCQRVIDSALEVQWCPGVEHPKFPHVRAGVNVEKWVPDVDYQFVKKGSLEVERVIIVEKIVEKVVEKEVPKTIVKYVEKKNKIRR